MAADLAPETVWWDRSEFDAVRVPDERGPVVLVCRRCGALVVRQTTAANKHVWLHARAESDHRAGAAVTPDDLVGLRRMVAALVVSHVAIVAAIVLWWLRLT